ncbi:MBL fold metallo-hydrolase [Rhizobium oryziradicis]|uniref:MBL fold metallo-hydrolase n=1 Tax=Rhizobium oryziradicis TaxID=1867956 RepID=A0A1Q8ZR33_9HYPH|nr:MBL fold metallo-hydrolase [Rhizobium oryziradicis]
MKLARLLFLSSALALASTFGTSAIAADSTPKSLTQYHQVADSYSFPLGDLQITSFSDGTVPQDLYKLLNGTSHAEIDGLLHKEYQANPVEVSINVFMIQDGKRTILVDTGSGDLFGPSFGGKVLDSLKSRGIKPQDVTDILITHIHTDHTGGLVHDGKPVFPNAIVHVSAIDENFFLNPENSKKTGYSERYFDEAIETVGVYNKLGKVKTFADNDTILPGIKVSIHPGHTPGSAFYTVTSEGKTIVFIGDTIHVAAVQFPEPKITIQYDVDPKQAATTRINAFNNLSAEDLLVAAPHLPFPGIGHISKEGNDRFGWHPVEYRNRASQ